MIIRKFKIENYRSIQKVEYNLNHSVNPIIGGNKSGKTSILKAILAFDKGRDTYNGGEHLNPENIHFKKDTTSCRITATLTLEKKELKILFKSIKKKISTEDYNIVKKFNTKTSFQLIRHLLLDGSEYDYINENLSNHASNYITRFLVEHLPAILYFNDFSNDEPEHFTFHEEYSSKSNQEIHKGKEWQKMLEELYRLAHHEEIHKHDIKNEPETKIDTAFYMSDTWKGIKKIMSKELLRPQGIIDNSSSTNIANDTEELEIVVKNKPETKRQIIVQNEPLKNVKDKNAKSKTSKGFQWFFKYMLKLKSDPQFRKLPEHSIFLLDEPESHLDSTHKSELLRELALVSKKNTIIYCTSSPFLLNPLVVKSDSIKIISKEDSNIALYGYNIYRNRTDENAIKVYFKLYSIVVFSTLFLV